MSETVSSYRPSTRLAPWTFEYKGRRFRFVRKSRIVGQPARGYSWWQCAEIDEEGVEIKTFVGGESSKTAARAWVRGHVDGLY